MVSRAASFEGYAQQEQDLAVQQAFVDLVSSIRKNNVDLLPNLVDDLDHKGGINMGLQDKIGASGIFLGQDFGQAIGDSQLPDRLDFLPQDMLRLGKEASQHKVFFGRLNATWFNGAKSTSIQLAVKPIRNSGISKAHLLHEVAMYQHLSKLGLPTLNIMGLALLDEPTAGVAGFVMTAAEPDLRMLDTLDWANMSQAEAWHYAGRATDQEALLAAHLIFHGDAEFKNVAIGTSRVAMHVVDLEYASSLRDTPEDTRKITQRLSQDFSSIGQSVGSFIFTNMPTTEKPTNDIARFELMHNYLYVPFLEKLVHQDTPHLDVLAAAYDGMVKQKLAFARGE